MKQVSAREQILNYLRQNRLATIPELSEVIGISRPAIRFHLKKLTVSQDVIQTTITTSPQGKGRPSHYFQLASHELPNNITGLLDWLLNFLTATKNESDTGVFMEKFTRFILSSENLQTYNTRNIKPLLKFFTSYQYEPKWETRKDGPRIIFSRCPYLEIINHHPELCVMDKLLIQQSLNLPAQQLRKIDPNKAISSTCIFQTFIS